jgi:glycosyltransferase involved in cell wall biosynthesis
VAHGLSAAKFTVIPNGVPPARASDVTRAELHASLGLPTDARLIAAVGRLWPQKRIKDLIWALDLVAVLHPNVWMLIIGDGPQRSDLERYASLVSNRERVRFLGHREDVWQILPHVDVLWQGSGYEGQSNAVMEAMASGVPVVATDIPGNRDLVVPGETGFLVPIAGRAQYARVTDRILSDADLARRLGEAGRAKVRDEFSVERMVAGYQRLYREIAASSR